MQIILGGRNAAHPGQWVLRLVVTVALRLSQTTDGASESLRFDADRKGLATVIDPAAAGKRAVADNVETEAGKVAVGAVKKPLAPGLHRLTPRVRLHLAADYDQSRLGLTLTFVVIPVFAPPREHGLQNQIESRNQLWQAKVWHRFHHANPAALRHRSDRFVTAHHHKTQARQDTAPARLPCPPCQRTRTPPSSSSVVPRTPAASPTSPTASSLIPPGLTAWSAANFASAPKPFALCPAPLPARRPTVARHLSLQIYSHSFQRLSPGHRHDQLNLCQVT